MPNKTEIGMEINPKVIKNESVELPATIDGSNADDLSQVFGMHFGLRGLSEILLLLRQ
jgi:hypothetical protein